MDSLCAVPFYICHNSLTTRAQRHSPPHEPLARVQPRPRTRLLDRLLLPRPLCPIGFFDCPPSDRGHGASRVASGRRRPSRRPSTTEVQRRDQSAFSYVRSFLTSISPTAHAWYTGRSLPSRLPSATSAVSSPLSTSPATPSCSNARSNSATGSYLRSEPSTVLPSDGTRLDRIQRGRMRGGRS